ncbi:MAG: response regulator [Planctomycetota bacterium]|jgi:DNA-binding NtrC family response regulator
MKILLVDDDELVRNSLSLAFKNKGCFLQTTETAEEGLQALENETFDIVISDFKLLRTDGLEFFKQATVFQPDTVNVLISTYQHEGVTSRASEAGVHAFIEKPFSLEYLTKSLGLLIEKRNAINRT